MKLIHLGSGEAVDEALGNNCHLVLSRTKLLLDCGYNAVSRILLYNNRPDFIDAIFISHLHADHFFGLAPLLLRWNTDGRRKPLAILSEERNIKKLKESIESGYAGLSAQFSFPIKWAGVKAGSALGLNEFRLSFAPTDHPASNFAIRIEANGKALCYSGDGMFTAETELLYEGADLVIHEAFKYGLARPGHCYMTALMDMAKRRKVKKVIFCHIERKERKKLIGLRLPKRFSIAKEGDFVMI